MSTGSNAATLANATALAQGLQALTEAVRTGCPDPADAIAALVALAGYAPATMTGGDAIGLAMSAAEATTSALCRRAAIASLALASADYQPSSYQDAVRVRTLLCRTIDAELRVAGNAHDFASYTALLGLRNAIVADLTRRGGDLADIVTVVRPVPLPAAVLAYQLYGDGRRQAELVREGDPVSSFFMPLAFKALSS